MSWEIKNPGIKHWANDKKSREEVIKKISEQKKGKPLTEKQKEILRKNNKGEGNPNYGNKWSEEKKKALSEKKKQMYKDNPQLKEKIKNNHWSKNPNIREKIIKKQSELICNLISTGRVKPDKFSKSGEFFSKK